MHSTNFSENKFFCSSLRKVVRHLCREATKAGFSLSGITGSGGPIAVSALAQYDFTSLGGDQLVLEFRRPKRLRIESVEIYGYRGQGGGCITYRGSGNAFNEVIAGVKTYALHSEMQNSYTTTF